MVKIHFRSLKNKRIIELLFQIKNERTQKSDAIIWLQGDRYDRSRKVLSLFKKRLANKIVVSGNNELIGLNKREDENNISLNEMVRWLKKRGIKSNQIIIEGRSFNTAEQAKNVLKLAQEKKWKKIILVASLYHQPRVFLTFFKEAKRINWKGFLINQPAKINWERIPSGRKKSCKGLFIEEIRKIQRYQSDISTIREALTYLRNNKYARRNQN